MRRRHVSLGLRLTVKCPDAALEFFFLVRKVATLVCKRHAPLACCRALGPLRVPQARATPQLCRIYPSRDYRSVAHQSPESARHLSYESVDAQGRARLRAVIGGIQEGKPHRGPQRSDYLSSAMSQPSAEQLQEAMEAFVDEDFDGESLPLRRIQQRLLPRYIAVEAARASSRSGKKNLPPQ